MLLSSPLSTERSINAFIPVYSEPTMASSIDIAQIRNAQRAQGPATILAIGTATPTNCILQADYPDYYFRITKSEHMVDLKEKFQRMCTYLLLLSF